MRNEEISLRLIERTSADAERGLVPAYRFYICDADGERVMGNIDLRVGFNERIYYGGNIGYGIDPEFRGHHYAGKACLLLLEFARKLGMEKLIITCNPDNIASRKTCDYIGAKLVEIVDLPPDNDMYLRGERRKCIYEIVL